MNKPSKHQDNERRRAARIAQNIPLKLSSADSDFVTETKNVSASGAYCRVDQYIEPMTKLDIQLLLPIRKGSEVTTIKVSCCGVVVRTESAPNDDGFDTAIFFNDIGPQEIAILKEFVEQSLSTPASE